MPRTTGWPRPRTPSTPPMPTARTAGRIRRPAGPRAGRRPGGTAAAARERDHRTAGPDAVMHRYEAAAARKAGAGRGGSRPAPAQGDWTEATRAWARGQTSWRPLTGPYGCLKYSR